MKATGKHILLILFTAYLIVPAKGKNLDPVHVYEMVEVTFSGRLAYDNPYMEVDLWVDLKGPGDLQYRIPAFWDGDQTWRARLAATAPGQWKW